MIKEILPEEPAYLSYTVTGSSVVLLDDTLNETSEGEIAISGPGLAIGYYQNESLTAEKFIVYKGVRYYLTGDYGRRIPSGIEFLGRRDRVVKNRGFLINLEAEIEAFLMGIPMVDSVAALMHEGRLITFLTPASVETTTLRRHLLETRDSFLVPDRMYSLSSFPMTSNGKVDYASLRRLLQEERFKDGPTDQSGWSPRLDLVLKGFSKVLGLPLSVLCGSSSFLDNGGNSLSAVGLVAHLRDCGLSITVRDIFGLDTPQLISDNLSTVSLSADKTPETDAEILRGNIIRAGYAVAPHVEVVHMNAIQINMVQATMKIPSMNYIQVSMTFDLTSGLFKPEVFRHAWEIIIRRHSILRASFIPALEATIIAVDPIVDWKESFVDRSEWESTVAVAREQILCSMEPLDAEYMKPHSLFRLITEPDTRTEFIWTVHHSLVDGWSIAVIMQDLQCVLSGGELPKVAQFTSAATVQRTLAQRTLSPTNQQFWADRFQNHIPAPRLRLPKPKSWPTAARAEGRQLLGVHRNQVQQFAQRHRVSDVSIFLASWALVLSKYLSTDHVLFGVVLSGRNLPMTAVDRVVGPLLDTIPFPADTTCSQSTTEFLRIIHHTIHDLNEFHLELNIETMRTGRESLETLLALQYDLPDSTWNLEPHTWPSPQSVRHSETTQLPLHILIDVQDKGELEARFLFDCSHFEREMIDQLLNHFRNIFQAILTHPTVELVKSCMMDPLEVNDLLYSSSHLHDKYEGPPTLKHAFESVADTWPEAIAVEIGPQSISYKELERRSNVISNVLHPLVRPGQVVGLLSDGSASWITAILAIIKAGAAYCPIDISLPEERIKVILSESCCSLLLGTTENLCGLWANHTNLKTLAIDRLLSEPLQSQERLPNRCFPEDPAVVIFTSGSTGVPKGI
jgi:non-ribosomal peptide synthetase component F